MTTGFAAAGAPAEADAPAASALGVAAWLAAVLMLFIYSQAWLVPLFGDTVDPQASGIVRAVFIPAYAAGVFLLALKPAAAFGGAIRQPFLILLMGIVVASISWSVAPDQTIRRAVAVLLTTASGVALGSRWRWPPLVELIGTMFAIIAVISLIVGVLFPSIGRMSTLFPGAWRGLWQEKNLFGNEMTFALLTFAAAGFMRPQRRWFWFGLAAMTFGLIIESTSKTALVSLMLGLAVLGLVLLIRRGGAIAVMAVYGAILALIALIAGIILTPEVFLGLLGKDATLTGRTKIWAAVMRQIQQSPKFGYGYGAVWTEEDNWGPLAWIVKQSGFKPDHAHNSWLEQWLGMGYLGLGAWTLYYLMTLVRTIMSMFTSDGALIVAPFLIVYTITTLTESVAVSYNDGRWVMLVAFSVRMALPDRDEPRMTAAGRRPQL